jgi:3-oxoacyl-[acyl-carrier protein] reductase
VRRLTNQFIPTMRGQRWGRIINITGANEPPGINIASVAKAALHNWAKGLSRELAADGITVNCLPPGRINSEQILERLHPTEENRQAFIAANIPIGFFGEPEDMAHLIAFLASPLARYITGEVIHVDGGMHRFAGCGKVSPFWLAEAVGRPAACACGRGDRSHCGPGCR